ncbi:hypothetical protein [Streptomyces sp. NPDC085460]|uniref:hypothetical protein n=1 Tax=unclassified Streptomyces TaxID=2593676 RepID=UPI0037D04BA0
MLRTALVKAAAVAALSLIALGSTLGSTLDGPADPAESAPSVATENVVVASEPSGNMIWG